MWAVGEYFDEQSITRPLAEHWDGSAWTMVAVSPDDGVSLFDVSADASDDAWAIGETGGEEPILIEHWDGASWTASPSDPTGSGGNLIAVVALSPDDVWAAGHYSTDGLHLTALVEHWDGGSWSIVSAPSPPYRQTSFSALSVVSKDDIWAVGNSFTFGSSSRTLVEHWDGATWSIVPSPSHGTFDTLTAIGATSATNAWAFGYYMDGGVDLLDGIRWDGSAWSDASLPPSSGRIVSAAVPAGTSVIGAGRGGSPMTPLVLRVGDAGAKTIPAVGIGGQSWAQGVAVIARGPIVLAGSMVFEHMTSPLVEVSCR
jgi:hypothetical protein